MHKDRLVVAALVGWLFVGLLSAAPQFVPGPSARGEHAMAYDSNRNVTVMFGGYGGVNGFLGDTWEWDGAAWHERTTSSPLTPRSGSMMAFDASRGVCVLFGGVDSSGSHFDETWEWDGHNWSLVATGGAGARRDSYMVFDTVKGVCVMHGGYDGSWLNDTWEWDGAVWTEVSTSSAMTARNDHQMAFDRSRGVAVLYGGNQNNGYNDETWEWDGATWSQINPASPPGNLSLYSMCYDVARQRVVMFGGRPSFSAVTDETWTWDGVGWTAVTSAISPQGRHGAGCVYDELRDEVVLFGGRFGSGATELGDTWIFDGAEWRPKLDYVTSPVNGNRYALTPPMTWQDAENVAVADGGHLVTIRNSQENSWLQQQYGNQDMLIGLNRMGLAGVWAWASGEPFGYSNWCSICPNNQPQETVAHFWPAHPGFWSDDLDTTVSKGIVEIVVPVPATASAFGVGCGSPALVMTPQGSPVLGGVGSAHITNVPAVPGFPCPLGGITLGFSDTLLSGLPILPLSLAISGMPGCELLHSNDVFGLPVALGSSPGTWDFSLPIPANANLLNSHVYLQAFAGAPGYNAAQFIVSNGVDWLIGNQ